MLISILSCNDGFNENLHTIKVYGNVNIGYYYINLFVGTPPQPQSLIIDTGSHVTTFPC